MTDKQPEALRLADAFGIPHWTGLPIALHVEAAAELRRLHEENEALRARLAQPKQPDYFKAVFGKPQNKWQGLTDEEAKKVFEAEHCRISADLAGILARAIEAKLKEKNGGV